MKNRDQRKFIIWGLLTLLVFTTVVYAALQTTLSVSGTVTRKGGSWDIHFENSSKANTSGTGTASTINIKSATTLEFSASVYKPNDSVTYTVDIKNDGTVDAKLDSIILSGFDDAKSANITYTVTYSDGTQIKEGDSLKSGAKKTLKLRIIYDDVNAIETMDINLTFGVTLLYIQDAGSATSTSNEIQKESVIGMHLIVDGDSLNAVRDGDNGEDIATVNWPQKVASALNLKYEIYTNDNGNIWYKDNFAKPWSMVAKNTEYINSTQNLNLSDDVYVNALVNRVKEVEATGDKVLLIINGGTNDALQIGIANENRTPFGTIDSTHDDTTYYGALQLWFDKLQAQIPEARIVFLGAPYDATVEGWYLRYGDVNELNSIESFPKIRIAQKEVCEKYGIEYIDLYNNVGANETTDYYDEASNTYVRKYLNINGTHYNTVAGSTAIANVIINALS